MQASEIEATELPLPCSPFCCIYCMSHLITELPVYCDTVYYLTYAHNYLRLDKSCQDPRDTHGDIITKQITYSGTKIKRKKQLFIFPSATQKTKELRLPPLLLPLPTKPPFPLLSIDGQGAFTISSSLAAKTISQSIISCRRRPKQENKRRSKSKSSSGLAFWLAKPKSWPSSFHFPSSIVVCSLFPSITASLENIIAEPEGKETKTNKSNSSIVKRKGIKNNALSIRLWCAACRFVTVETRRGLTSQKVPIRWSCQRWR